MKISDIFRQERPVDSTRANKADQTSEQAQGRAAQVANQQGEDSVVISPKARQFQQIARIVAEDEVTRQDRVAKLKEEVNSGEYQNKVSSEDIAKSLMSFVNDSNSA